ncbi:hypothetical protein [Adlercreutzia caecimuris]|uniref:hypothetical protein n=1 Tax=Adlercreutzia caecimuris TaxID=671266 RepID=UPI00214B274C|nr:hypothetical protein [Adlercreutzia caecimuris]MCR2038097.1 hypothetical protein [Adlercreutzia caecimuris]
MAASTRKPIPVLLSCLFAGCLAASLSACAGQPADDIGRNLASTSPTEQTAENAGDEEAPATSSEADASAETSPAQKNDAPSPEPADSDTAPDATPSAKLADKTASPESADSDAEASADAAATTATIMYYENVSYDDGDVEPDDEGRVLLGTYELKDVHVGQTLNAWDYVVDIPGYFFWDGWPQNLTLGENPDDNVIKLFYFKLWNNEYTVNYYLMENADLSADNWKDALKPDDVKFIKMGSETFTDQRFDKLVKGDAYEYKIDGTYVVDTYPTEIRVGVNPDDNVINVLYVPDSPNIPDGVKPPDDETKPDDTMPPDGEAAPDGGTTQPDDGAAPDNGAAPAPDGTMPPDGGEAPDQSGEDNPSNEPADSSNDGSASTPDGGTSAPSDRPNDTTFNKDEIEAAVPSKDEVVNDFIASGDAHEKVEITDEMIENPVSKTDTDYVKNVYETGLREGEKLAQTGDRTAFAVVAAVAVTAGVVVAIAFTLRHRNQRKND